MKKVAITLLIILLMTLSFLNGYQYHKHKTEPVLLKSIKNTKNAITIIQKQDKQITELSNMVTEYQALCVAQNEIITEYIKKTKGNQ